MGNKIEIVYCNKRDCTNNIHSNNGYICVALKSGYGGNPCQFYKLRGETPEETIRRIKRMRNSKFEAPRGIINETN